MDQGYDVIFAERFRQLGHPDFKRVFLKRRMMQPKPGLIAEGGLTLGGAGHVSRPLVGAGGLVLRGRRGRGRGLRSR